MLFSFDILAFLSCRWRTSQGAYGSCYSLVTFWFENDSLFTQVFHIESHIFHIRFTCGKLIMHTKIHTEFSTYAPFLAQNKGFFCGKPCGNFESLRKNCVYNLVDNFPFCPQLKIQNVETWVINSLSTVFPQFPVDIQSSCSVSKDNSNVTKQLFPRTNF